jgi:hypothetical protein
MAKVCKIWTILIGIKIVLLVVFEANCDHQFDY